MRVVDVAYERAKAYVDEQLSIDQQYGRRAKMSKEEYAQLVRRIARLAPRASQNGTAKRARR
jgi:hypothetical protein